MANEFTNYFATICAKNEIPDINTHFSSYLNTPIESTFNFELIDNATAMHYLSKLTPSHSCGYDNLSAITLKCIAILQMKYVNVLSLLSTKQSPQVTFFCHSIS